MAINSISIKNFQSHENTHLELSDGMNVICGPSDNGKSSIIRSIRWVILNRPAGDEFRRHSTDKTSVTLKTDNLTVKRKRSDRKNEYRMNDVVFRALRSSVPEDVSAALNLSEANIQSQHEVYFLVDDSAGQRSRTLNKVAGLQIMDEVLKRVNSQSRSINSDIKAVNSQLVDTRNRILDLEWVSSADKFLKKLEEFQDRIEDLEEEYDYITSIIEQLQKLERMKSRFLSSGCVSEINTLLEKNNTIEEEYERYSKIIMVIQGIEELRKQLDSLSIIDVSELEKLYDMISSEENKLERIVDIVEEIEFRKTQHKQIKSELAKTEKKVKNELKRLGKCPTCGSKI